MGAYCRVYEDGGFQANSNIITRHCIVFFVPHYSVYLNLIAIVPILA